MGSATDFNSKVFYDVSTWTLPLAFNLLTQNGQLKELGLLPLGMDRVRSPRPFLESQIGYLIDWRSSDSASLLYGLLDTGAKVRVGKTAPYS